MRVSVIATVLNEGASIRRLLASLAAQTRPADEIVLVDGGSTDDTVEIIRQHAAHMPVRVLVVHGANISLGRNLAIDESTGEVIAATDAGVWLEPGWLAALMAPMEAGRNAVPVPSSAVEASTGLPPTEVPVVETSGGPYPTTRRGVEALAGYPADQRICQVAEVVSGFFVSDAVTPFEVAMGATVLPDQGDVDPRHFLPSSRSVAFTRRAWQAAGGYPEWLDYCEDLIFDLRLRAVTGPFAWAPKAVAHFRPRGSISAFFRQYYRYARGDGKADLWRRRHAIRYATYLVGLPLGAWLAVDRLWLGGGLLLLAAAAYCRAPYRRLWRRLRQLSPLGRAQALCWVPIIRLVGDLAKMLGYPAGWVWRLRNWRRSEIHSRIGEHFREPS